MRQTYKNIRNDNVSVDLYSPHHEPASEFVFDLTFVSDSINRLKGTDKFVIRAAYSSDKKRTQIARSIGRSEETIKERLANARARLKRIVDTHTVLDSEDVMKGIESLRGELPSSLFENPDHECAVDEEFILFFRDEYNDAFRDKFLSKISECYTCTDRLFESRLFVDFSQESPKVSKK